ncbi:MAG: formylglycine-generating enzyme family protein [Polyangiaceae bacterium]
MSAAPAWLALALVGLAGCRDKQELQEAAPSASVLPLAPPGAAPTPRKGMMHVPKGALVAGTPPNRLPRIADEEMPGEQVILGAFYIDVFPFPNEEGAIPRTNVTRDEAEGLCAERGKRLCSELEWERACKGPSNRAYEYGDSYRAERCGTGKPAGLRPSGLLVGCKSDFGVSDMHGGIWEWTSSSWGRGVKRELATLRGGNAPAGELVGRCANAMGRPPETRDNSIGFRCCLGDKNDAEVVLNVVRGKALEYKDRYDRELAAKALAKLPEDARKDVGKDTLKVERVWIWRPIGNEELFLLGGCTGIGRKPACGILVTRVVLDEPHVVGWVSSGHWAPTVHGDTDARDLWLFGGDDLGNFRRVVAYLWGRISIGPKERRVPKPKKKKKKK